MASSHPCTALLPVELPTTVDEFLEKAMGGPSDLLLKSRITDPTLFRVEVDLRDLARMAGDEWQQVFRQATQAKSDRIQAGHANH